MQSKGGNILQLKEIFTKRKKYATIPNENSKIDVPQGLMQKCKNCNKLNNEHRRKNMTQEQYIRKILKTTRNSTYKRYKANREEATEYNITYEFIISLLQKQDGKCKLSGIPLEYKPNSINNLSIDRIDSNKGYTKDNIQLVTWAVNQSKNNLTNEQFLDLVSKIYKHSLS